MYSICSIGCVLLQTIYRNIALITTAFALNISEKYMTKNIFSSAELTALFFNTVYQ